MKKLMLILTVCSFNIFAWNEIGKNFPSLNGVEIEYIKKHNNESLNGCYVLKFDGISVYTKSNICRAIIAAIEYAQKENRSIWLYYDLDGNIGTNGEYCYPITNVRLY